MLLMILIPRVVIIVLLPTIVRVWRHLAVRDPLRVMKVLSLEFGRRQVVPVPLRSFIVILVPFTLQNMIRPAEVRIMVPEPIAL